VLQVPLRIVYCEPPRYVHSQAIYGFYHQSDVAKLRILLDHGGIYLDTDVIVVNSLDPLRRYDATLGKTRLHAAATPSQFHGSNVATAASN